RPGRGRAMYFPVPVSCRTPSASSASSADAHVSCPTPQRRHACSRVSFSPGMAAYSSRMRSTSRAVEVVEDVEDFEDIEDFENMGGPSLNDLLWWTTARRKV